MSTNYTTKRNDLFVFSVFSILIVGIPFILAWNSSSSELRYKQSFCPFKMLSGLPCPGCGITKSIVALYEGAIPESIEYHPFGIVVFGLAATFLFAQAVLNKAQVDKLYYHFFRNRKLTIGLAVGMSVYHIIRLYYFLSSHTFDDVLRESIWR